MHEQQAYTHWASDPQKSLTTAHKKRVLNVYPDTPDHRDYVYQPALIRTRLSQKPGFTRIRVLDQGKEGACTGFALAATINFLKYQDSKKTPTRNNSASPRMLYELARKHDEWPGVQYAGSSCRGAIKGWYSMGVCTEKDYPYVPGKPGILTVKRAKEARKTRIGAYYRIKHRLADFHTAITEAGAIFVSASIHDGWKLEPCAKNAALPVIRIQVDDWKHAAPKPGHAFSIVGYTELGFIVQNSWGEKWGRGGFAVWSYEDWYENIRDAWVFRLSLSTPSIWQVSTRLKSEQSGSGLEGSSNKPVRSEIAGHFVHIDDGDFHDHGDYDSNLEDVRQTAELLAQSPVDKYQHLLFYAHGGLNSPPDSAIRIRAMKDVFKKNKIYPYHFMYDTGLMEEIKDVILRKLGLSSARSGWSPGDVSDYLIEKSFRGVGRSIWREIKRGARSPFDDQRAGWLVIGEFLSRIQQTRPDMKIHIVGHSTGAILIAYMLNAMEAKFPALRVDTLSLMAPAATTDLFKSHYKPLLATPDNLFGIDGMTVYNLDRKREKDDNVFQIYRKSLLYLVSHSFEEQLGGSPEEDTEGEQFGARLLGMQRYSVPIDRSVGKQAEFLYSGSAKAKGRTDSQSHGGFDNDEQTMNDILKRVLGNPSPERPFTAQDLKY